MSVINSALRDLQQQRPRLRVIDPEELRRPSPSGTRRKPLAARWVLMLLLALALLAAGYLWLPVVGSQPRTASPPAVDEAGQPAVPAAGQVERASARLEGLQIREDEQTLTLGFRLSSATGIYLQQQSGRRYRFVIDAARSRIPAPQLAENDWIEALRIRPQAADLEIELLTTEGVRIETRDSRLGDGGQLWQLSLHRPPARPPQTEMVTEAPVREPVETAAPVMAKPAPASQPVAQAPEAKPAPVADEPSAAASETAVAESAQPGRLEIRASRVPAAPDPALERRRAAHGLFRSGDYAGLIRRFAGDPAQDDLLALAYQRLGRHEQAVALYHRLLRRQPENARHWLGLAMSLEQQGALDEALAAYRRARQPGDLSPRLDAFARERLTRIGHGGEE